MHPVGSVIEFMVPALGIAAETADRGLPVALRSDYANRIQFRLPATRASRNRPLIGPLRRQTLEGDTAAADAGDLARKLVYATLGTLQGGRVVCSERSPRPASDSIWCCWSRMAAG